MSSLHHIEPDPFPEILDHDFGALSLPSCFYPNPGSQDDGDVCNILQPCQGELMQAFVSPMQEYRNSPAGTSERNESNFNLSDVTFDAEYPGLDRSFNVFNQVFESSNAVHPALVEGDQFGEWTGASDSAPIPTAFANPPSALSSHRTLNQAVMTELGDLDGSSSIGEWSAEFSNPASDQLFLTYGGYICPFLARLNRLSFNSTLPFTT